jgi:hypothetical protein
MQTLEQLREQDRRTAADPGVVGLGGWLVLPLLGMLGAPIIAVMALPEIWPLIGEPTFTAAQRLVFWFELIGNGVVKVAAPVALLVLFFRRKRLFAVYYITWLVAGIALMLLDLLFVYHAFRAYYDSPGVVFWDEQTKRDLGQTIFGAAIWIPYMLNSKRVQNTFVN